MTSDRLQFLNDYCVDGPGGPFDPDVPLAPDGNCQVRPLAEREVIVNTQIDQSKSYTAWLPSLNVVYEVVPDVVVRGAVAKVIARPSFTALGAPRSLTLHLAAYALHLPPFAAYQ